MSIVFLYNLRQQYIDINFHFCYGKMGIKNDHDYVYGKLILRFVDGY